MIHSLLRVDHVARGRWEGYLRGKRSKILQQTVAYGKRYEAPDSEVTDYLNQLFKLADLLSSSEPTYTLEIDYRKFSAQDYGENDRMKLLSGGMDGSVYKSTLHLLVKLVELSPQK
jgi:hypothetical protein